MEGCNGCIRLALIVASLSAAAIGTADALAGEQLVRIGNFAFSPQNVTVAVGTTVTFLNDDDMVHTIVAENGSFRSKALDTGDKYSFTFDKAGDYAFVCGLHPFMHGKIAVTQ
jgi:plastocyanin